MRAHNVDDNLVLLEEMFNGKLTVPEIRNLLPQVFPELDPVQGPFAQLGMHDERTRSLSAMLSIVWLHLDVYDSFTAKHVQSSALTRERWTEMQGQANKTVALLSSRVVDDLKGAYHLGLIMVGTPYISLYA